MSLPNLSVVFFGCKNVQKRVKNDRKMAKNGKKVQKTGKKRLRKVVILGVENGANPWRLARNRTF
jgi:hypothetical protein